MSVRIVLVEGIEKWRAQSGEIDHSLSLGFTGKLDLTVISDHPGLRRAVLQLQVDLARL
jgi:hypothetical protein